MTARGYDRDHRILRLLCFQRDNWKCVDCGWQPDMAVLYQSHHLGDPPTDRILEELRHRQQHSLRHLHADHIVPIADDPSQRLDIDNLATRCDQCHNRRTARQQLQHRIAART
jgi:5-methylcytosine-specific restriction endonuclease McrA